MRARNSSVNILFIGAQECYTGDGDTLNGWNTQCGGDRPGPRAEGYTGILERVERVLCCDGTLSVYQLRVYGSGKWEIVAESYGAPLATCTAPADVRMSVYQ